MSILVTASSAFPRWKGDTEPRFVYDLARGCAARFQTTVLLPHHPGAKAGEKLDGMRVLRFPYFLPPLQKLCYDGGINANRKRSVLARIQLPFLIAAELIYTKIALLRTRPNIVHAHWIVPQGFIAALLKPFFGFRLIVTAHAGDIFILKSPIMRFFAKFAVNKADAITVNSAFTKAAVEKLTKKPIDIIPMGVSLKNFKGKPTQKEPTILFVGRLAEKKGLAYLLRAMPRIIREIPSVKLIIVGTGPEEQHLKRLARQLKLQDTVLFAGGASHDELPKFYSASTLLVLPSIITKSGDTEGLGVVLLEALASGVPVVATSVGGIPDVVINNKTGILIPQKNAPAIAEAALRLIKSKSLQSRLRKNGLIHVKKFSWDTVTKQFLALYSR